MLRKIVLASCLAILASAIHDDNKHSEKSSETPCVHVKSKFSELEIGGTGVFTIQACEPLELSQTVVLGLPDCVFTKTTEVTLPAGKSVAVPVTVIAAEYGTGKISLRGNEIGVVLGAVAVSVVKHSWVQTISTIIGWLYFTAWSVSFYPQCIENYQLQSVAGLSFDFVYLNLLGWVCYSIYNISLYFVPLVQNEYLAKYPGSDIPVKTNDVFFAVHALVLTSFQLFYQMRLYDAGGQYLSRPALIALVAMGCAAIVSAFASSIGLTSALTFVTNLSFLKLIVTITKYIPQALHNFRRKSTVGWSIHNILLDFTGGVLSIFQMMLIAFNLDDLTGFFGNPAKFALGLISIAFDVLFMTQHYILYKDRYGSGDGYSAVDTASDYKA